MLRRLYSNRSLRDNVMLGTLTAFSAGMVNVTSLIIFLAFTSNVTGHYAILAQEIARGNWMEAGVVLGWISLFFLGNFVANVFVVNSRSQYLSHAMPLILEIACMVFIGIYLQEFYASRLWETELMVAIMLFAMGLQNGLTASVSNMSLKTTHLTGLTTDLAISFSMLTKKEYRQNAKVVEKAWLLGAVLTSYMVGGVVAGIVYLELRNGVFFVVSGLLAVVILYDLFKITIGRYISGNQPFIRKSYYEREVIRRD
ncbi:MAG TPA: YoaK family protein [Cyclobacteriaceae bacterium]|nr:YoaK family protein [Cyclobacteriaceae bacterium]